MSEQVANDRLEPPTPTPPTLSQQLSATPRPLPNGDPAVNDDINVLALIKGKERYIFLYDDSQRAETLRMLGRHASNPELSFSWYDAAVLSQKIRQEERATALAPAAAASDRQRRAVLGRVESGGSRVEGQTS